MPTIALLILAVVIGVPTTPYDGKSDGDFVIAPPYAEAPELTTNPNVPKGEMKSFTMESKDSKFYPGISKTQSGTVPYKRNVAIYIPAKIDPAKPLPFIVCQDAMGQKFLPTILDNLISQNKVPAMIAIFVQNGGGDGKGSERGLEYDTVSPKYADFIETEVLPRVESECHIKLSQDPKQRATMGCSSGAAAAFTMAWFHPDRYGKVLSYSGTYVNQQSPENPQSPHGAWEYHEHLIPQSDARPIRIWIEVGEKDNRADDPESTYHNWLLANVRMAAALKAKGYHYQFVYAKDAKHCDQRVIHQTLPAALEWLWRKD